MNRVNWVCWGILGLAIAGGLGTATGAVARERLPGQLEAASRFDPPRLEDRGRSRRGGSQRFGWSSLWSRFDQHNDADDPGRSRLGGSQWQMFLDFFRRDVDDQGRQRRGGSRGELCVITPADGDALWHPRPLFVFRGNMAAIALRAVGQDDPLWLTQTLPATDPAVIPYDGPALKPGQTYEWLFYALPPASGFDETLAIPFQIMPAGSERVRTAVDLRQLQAQMATQDANAEAIAQARAAYFLDSDRWSDALQEMFAVSNPSAELSNARTTLIEEICSDTAVESYP